jgi:hypothetical protein
MAQEAEMPETARFYDPETIAIMKLAFDEACAAFPLGALARVLSLRNVFLTLQQQASAIRRACAPMHCGASTERRDR